MIEQITLDEVLKLVMFENFDGSVGVGWVESSQPRRIQTTGSLVGKCGCRLSVGGWSHRKRHRHAKPLGSPRAHSRR